MPRHGQADHRCFSPIGILSRTSSDAVTTGDAPLCDGKHNLFTDIEPAVGSLRGSADGPTAPAGTMGASTATQGRAFRKQGHRRHQPCCASCTW